MLFLLCVLNQRSSHSGIVGNELPVVPALSEESPKGFQRAGEWPLSHDLGVLLGYLEALRAGLVS